MSSLSWKCNADMAAMYGLLGAGVASSALLVPALRAFLVAPIPLGRYVDLTYGGWLLIGIILLSAAWLLYRTYVKPPMPGECGGRAPPAG